jgi:uncharacterized membrane protein
VSIEQPCRDAIGIATQHSRGNTVMNISTRNIDAWNDPNNWSRRGIFGLYFAKNDSRLLVRKPMTALGWTLNFARPASTAILLAIIVGAATIVGLAAIAKL